MNAGAARRWLIAACRHADQAPHDPHQIAPQSSVHCKALHLLYLDILDQPGDAAYRAMTPDGLSEAKLWYVRARPAGPAPNVRTVAP